MTAATLFGPLSQPSTGLLAAAAGYFEKSTVDPELQGEFWAAWNAVAFRFTSCAEAAEAFASSVEQHGDAPPQPHRYIQEREFFHFVLGVQGNADGQALAAELAKIQGSPNYSELDDIRRVLFHRGLPGRNIVGGGVTSYKNFAGTPGPAITPTTTRDKLAWIGTCLAAVIPRVKEWVVRTS